MPLLTLSTPKRELFKRAVAIFIGLVVAVGLLEVICQVFYAFYIAPRLAAQQQHELHYYQPSKDPRLVYELKPGYHIETEGRRIAIDANGIRDDGQYRQARRKIAIIGDSVPFGTGLSQEQTLPAALQQLLGDSIKVLNLGVPGYGLEEISRLLEIRWPQYQPEEVIYLLNFNDFSRRNTVYEGADNGLYRIYCPPGLKMPFLLRKAVYRIVKGGEMSSVAWYHWLYEGNKAEGLAELERMAHYARNKGFGFSVVLFPPAIAYTSAGFALESEFKDLCSELSKRSIPCYDATPALASNPPAFQDNTDHLLPEGSEALAAWMKANVIQK